MWYIGQICYVYVVIPLWLNRRKYMEIQNQQMNMSKEAGVGQTKKNGTKPRVFSINNTTIVQVLIFESFMYILYLWQHG